MALLSFVAGSLITARLGDIDQARADSNRIFELRVYHTLPGKAPLLESRFRDTTSKILAKHDLKVVGYWVPEGAPRKRDNGHYTFTYRRALLHPASGELEVGEPSGKGWAFTVTSSHREDLARVPAFPIRCPQCGDDWEMFRTSRRVEDPSRTRSPIRTMGTGFEKANQVLSDTLLRNLGASRHIVVFSDSRQDAARISAGLDKSHYQDLVRQLV
ncbi:MAG: hypothetical protein ACLPZJ_14655, partial [Terriglobales bacterium]